MVVDFLGEPQSSDIYDVDLGLRKKDYWALILAKLTNQKIRIFSNQDNESKDKAIAELLKKIE